jgi:hypothetical protein
VPNDLGWIRIVAIAGALAGFPLGERLGRRRWTIVRRAVVNIGLCLGSASSFAAYSILLVLGHGGGIWVVVGLVVLFLLGFFSITCLMGVVGVRP